MLASTEMDTIEKEIEGLEMMVVDEWTIESEIAERRDDTANDCEVLDEQVTESRARTTEGERQDAAQNKQTLENDEQQAAEDNRETVRVRVSAEATGPNGKRKAKEPKARENEAKVARLASKEDSKVDEKDIPEILNALRIRGKLKGVESKEMIGSLLERHVNEDYAERMEKKVVVDPKLKGKNKKRRERQKNLRDTALVDPRTNNLSPNPIVVGRNCKKCGSSRHVQDTFECPVVRYHLRKPIIWKHCSPLFFATFPCIACGSTLHTTVVCSELHSYCSRCGVRGHREGSYCNKSMNEKEATFKRLQHVGMRTRRATEEKDRWGFRPRSDPETIERQSGEMSEDDMIGDLSVYAKQ